MGMALVTQHVMNACQEDYGNAVLVTGGTLSGSNKTEHFIYKGEWVNTCNTFKRRLAFSFTVMIWLKTTLLKSFIAN